MSSSANGPLRVGIGGPVGSGKTALMERLCQTFRDVYDICAITNDIYTKEDALILTRAGALPEEPIRPASEEFELVQRASGAGLVSTKAMSMGVTIAALLFLLGVCVGCVCSLRLVAVVLTCGLCGRERQRKRGEKKD